MAKAKTKTTTKATETTTAKTAEMASVNLASTQMQTEKKMASFSRILGGKIYIGLKAEAINGDDVILPVDANDGDKFYCVDTSENLIFYKGVWYKQK